MNTSSFIKHLYRSTFMKAYSLALLDYNNEMNHHFYIKCNNGRIYATQFKSTAVPSVYAVDHEIDLHFDINDTIFKSDFKRIVESMKGFLEFKPVARRSKLWNEALNYITKCIETAESYRNSEVKDEYFKYVYQRIIMKYSKVISAWFEFTSTIAFEMWQDTDRYKSDIELLENYAMIGPEESKPNSVLVTSIVQMCIDVLADIDDEKVFKEIIDTLNASGIRFDPSKHISDKDEPETPDFDSNSCFKCDEEDKED